MTTTEKSGDKVISQSQSYFQISNETQLDRSSITPESILKAAQKTLAPYKLTYNYCHWWTAYQIGQRIDSNYSKSNRIFLAGDAVHTHSPKAGQGMNVSMQDSSCILPKSLFPLVTEPH
jgi:2-polyprenyl-6-methoxyphenol hydroxylase-like FAD-dependent oxidoreductase